MRMPPPRDGADERRDDRPEMACFRLPMRLARALTATTLATVATALVTGCGAGAQLDAVRVPEAYLPPIAPEPAPAAAAANGPTTVPARKPVAAPAAPATQVNGAPTDAEVAAELKQAFKGGSAKSSGDVDAATVGADGLATIPLTAPPKLRAMIVAANQVARKPYVYGGGHGGGPEGIFTDSAYDCSGSISYALASAGFIKSPLASGGLETFGKPGPGKWVSIYADAGHTFMTVAGLRFDTSGRDKNDTRWQSDGRSGGGMTVRHPSGL